MDVHGVFHNGNGLIAVCMDVYAHVTRLILCDGDVTSVATLRPERTPAGGTPGHRAHVDVFA